MNEKDNEIAKAIRDLRESAASLQESLQKHISQEKETQEQVGAFGRARKNNGPIERQAEHRRPHEEKREDKLYDAADRANEVLYYNELALHNHGLSELNRAKNQVEYTVRESSDRILQGLSREMSNQLAGLREQQATMLEEMSSHPQQVTQQAPAELDPEVTRLLSDNRTFLSENAQLMKQQVQMAGMAQAKANEQTSQAAEQLETIAKQMEVAMEANNAAINAKINELGETVKVLESQLDNVSTKRGLASIANSVLVAIVFSGVNLLALVALILMLMGVIPT